MPPHATSKYKCRLGFSWNMSPQVWLTHRHPTIPTLLNSALAQPWTELLTLSIRGLQAAGLTSVLFGPLHLKTSHPKTSARSQTTHSILRELLMHNFCVVSY